MKKSHRILCILIAALLPTLLIGCGAHKEAPRQSLLNDPGFSYGFNLKGLSSVSSASVIKTLQYGTTMDREPVWGIGQWGSSLNLADGEEGAEGDSYYYRCRDKSVTVNRKTSELKLELLAEEHYKDRPRAQGEPWPHLLIEQNFRTITRLNEYDSVRVELTYTLDYLERKLSDRQYNPAIHTGQLVFFMTIRNNDAYSEDKGNYYWFGMPLYDYRYEYPESNMQVDGGKEDATGKLIYKLDSRLYYREPPGPGVRQTISMDILPYVLQSFERVQASGAFRASEIGHMSFGGMNLGWEMPGTFNGCVTVSEFNITYRLKDAA